MPRTPSRDELQAAYGRTVPDLVAPGLRVVLCGINPSLWSGVVGYHFARPSNRLWPTLHGAGFTPRRLHPAETDAQLSPDSASRTSCHAHGPRRRAVREELLAGPARLDEVARRWQPRWIAFLGLSAYRTAYRRPKAVVGAQDEVIGGSRVWLLPNPSGLNASYQLPDLITAYAELRAASQGDA